MSKTRLFIVEDEALIAMELRDHLEQLGYEVCGNAARGEEAIERIPDLNPDLILMDIRLAGKMDGIEAAKRLKERIDVPIIYLTAYSDSELIERAKLTDSFGYLLKPFNEREIGTTIELALYKYKMEEKLKESEKRYRTLFEAAGDAIFILEAEGRDAGRIVDANEAAAKMHGYTVEELLTMNITDLDAPEDAKKAPGMICRILKGEWITQEIDHVRKDGTLFPVECSAGLLALDRRRYILAIDRDFTERKKAEKELKAALDKAEEEKGKTEAIIAAIGEGISIHDTDFKVLFQNQVLIDMIGEHKGETCYNAYEGQKDICRGCGMALSFQDGRIHNVQRDIMTDRGKVYVDVTASPVRDSAGKIIAGIEIVRDVTGRKKMEMALLRANRALRTLSRCNEKMVRAYSETELLLDICEVIVSEGGYMLAWVGYAEEDEERTVRPVQQYGYENGYLEAVRISWSDTELGRGPAGTAIRTASPFVIRDVQNDQRFAPWRDEAVQRRYSSVLGLPLVLDDGTIGALTIYSSDPDAFDEEEIRLLSELADDVAFGVSSLRVRAARDRLEKDREKLVSDLQATLGRVSDSQREWQETFDSITDLVSIHDRDFNIIRANKAFKQYFGVPVEELLNKKCYRLFHCIEEPLGACPHKMSLHRHQPVTEEFTEPNTKRIFRVSAYPYHSPHGEHIGSIHIARDITVEKEREMRQIMTERLASLGQMASGIAHEINNPLASISGCAEGLLDSVQNGEFDAGLFNRYLKIILEEISRCKNITTGMLSFVRVAPYERNKINLNDEISKTLEIIGFQGRLKDVEVRNTFAEDPLIAEVNEAEVRQVLLSLISNALDAMENRGVLTIASGSGDGNASIEISDTGPGIPDDIIGRIFDPFFTTKSGRGGTGLGLPIARKIIINHHGDIKVTSEKGKGTTFRMELPVGEDTP